LKNLSTIYDRKKRSKENSNDFRKRIWISNDD
jgi:hypothetical protein